MEISISEAIRLRISTMMKEQKISENELATCSGVTTSTLNSFMNNNKSSCTMNTLAKVCCGLGISVAEFFSHPYFKMKVVGNSLISED